MQLLNPVSEIESGIFCSLLVNFQSEEINGPEKMILCIFSQYRLNSGNIEKKFSHIGILRKNSQFFGFNLLLNLIYVIAIIEHSNL